MSIASVHLQDPAAESTADVLVGYGFNCYRFVTQVGGQSVDVLWATPEFAQSRERASGNGIPLLFPFPGRIQGTSLDWQGKSYPLHAGDGRGNAIHGFVHERPWRVLHQTASEVSGQFQASLDDPALLDHWPADFCLTTTYRLSGARLSMSAEVFNPGDHPLPWGFGTHPYFRVPLTPAGHAERCRLVLPVSRQWVLQDMNATGEIESLADASRYQAGFALSDARFDNVFTGLVPQGNSFISRVEDPDSGLAIQMRFGAPFRECVVYTPPHREAVCIEPYTCVPDAFRLQAAGIDGGLQLLAPGQRISVDVEIEVVPL